MRCDLLYDKRLEKEEHLRIRVFPAALLVNGSCVIVSAGERIISVHSGHCLGAALQSFAI